MKVLQTIASMVINAGGPTTCTLNLVEGLRKINVEIDILTNDVVDEKDKLISTASFMKIIKPPRETRYGYSKTMTMWLKSNIRYDLYHSNAIWQYSTHATSKQAIQVKKAHIISPHGMLFPEALEKSKWIKKISLLLYQLNDLKRATAFHATSIQEMNHIRALGLKQPIAVIPNGIDLSSIKKPSFEIKKGKQKIGFMGRLDPIKNLENLIRAWSQLNEVTENAELVIIGDGNKKYKLQLFALSKKLKINNIRFTGFVTGKKQNAVLNELSYLVLPSKSENFGMVVAEALTRGIPVIASKGSPWEELNTRKCGWWVDNNVEMLAKTIEKALSTDEIDRIEMGKRGYQLIKNKYSIECVAVQMLEFYNWILKNDKKPNFVNEL
jgi:glycosyltransferase involved in cell wall biosynthesis